MRLPPYIVFCDRKSNVEAEGSSIAALIAKITREAYGNDRAEGRAKTLLVGVERPRVGSLAITERHARRRDLPSRLVRKIPFAPRLRGTSRSGLRPSPN